MTQILLLAETVTRVDGAATMTEAAIASIAEANGKVCRQGSPDARVLH